MKATAPAVAAAVLLALGGCASRSGEIDATGGITAVRSACPAVAVPAGTGDVTLFDPAGDTSAAALDVTATMTDVRSTCDDSGEQVATTVTFTVQGRRVRTDAARDVQLPYFITVVRGGSAVVAKRVGQVQLHFDAGQPRAQVSGQATTQITRSAATLPQDVRDKLTRRRKAGDEDAAVDPLTTPEVRQAVQRVTFEALVGFQLTDAQLRYNVTR
ncbi:hypothetical protein SAMN05192583_0419 [Sphingomonas gellani]|uniref:Lipoprotein n=1 Tax=Sphingomonas gellani TaxID=1166340 RepID=A0A1H7YXD8_9SPHN|nr:hypothetical protein [Sphingomonas gellani]SEM49947.1 hypothetical protein SAMN05192583_0419 [Sphingomonas gellani]